MSSFSLSTFYFLLLLSCIYVTAKNVIASSKQDVEMVDMAHSKMLQTIEWGRRLNVHTNFEQNMTNFGNNIAIEDCLNLYEDSEPRLMMVVLRRENSTHDDVVTWLSAALAGHNSCLDGLEEKGGLLMKSQEAQI
ncbi:hypothetical protein LIER_41886 [Lithospermum erythrorhizon]|uniref:Pectinesterase inhibitor domain-containing protein n=1 Tax=Lithospermum erythrorhizon TaxID=34254 RepID=A0AAV3RFV8_LITER